MTLAAMAADAYPETRSAARFTHEFGLPYRPRSVPQQHLAKVIDLAEHRERRGLPRWGINSPIRHQEPEPGAYAAAGAGWLSREHYLQVIVPLIVGDFREVLKRHKVSEATFVRWVTTESLYAQHKRSGRDVIVRPSLVAELMACCVRTVQNCRATAREIGMYVDLVKGRMLTLDESTEARKNGSPQRGLSNVSCFLVPAQYHHRVTRPAKPSCPARRRRARQQARGTATVGRLNDVRPAQAATSSVDCCTPTRGGHFGTTTSKFTNSRTLNTHSVRAKTDAATPRRRKGKRESAGLRLAVDLVRRVEWLQTCSPGRIAPQLARYAVQAAPWTAEDLIAAFAAVDRQHGHWAPRAAKTRPWGLLRWYLGQITATTGRYRQRSRRARQRPWCGHCDSASYRWITHSTGWAEPCPTCSPQAVLAQEPV